MASKPINDLIDIFRSEGKFYNEPAFYIGVVKTTLPNISVSFNGLTLTKENLQISSNLLTLHNSIEHSDKISSGDTVIMVKNDEKFIIISKVVNL